MNDTSVSFYLTTDTTKQLAYVALTREKSGLTVITDSKEALEKQLDKSQSEKTSAIEVLGILGDPEAIRRDIEAMIRDPLGNTKDDDKDQERDRQKAAEMNSEVNDKADIQKEMQASSNNEKSANPHHDSNENQTQKSNTEFVDALLASLPERDLGLDR